MYTRDNYFRFKSEKVDNPPLAYTCQKY